MAQSALYPSEHRTLRVLELACPDSDADLRENCAYLVSQRRMTIDEAIDYVKGEEVKGKNSAATLMTTTAPSRARVTTTGATRGTVAVPVVAPEASLRSSSRSNRPPPACPRPRACERESSEAGDDNVWGAYPHGYRPASTQPSTTTESTTAATCAVPASVRSAAAPPMPADTPDEIRTSAHRTTRQQYPQRVSALTVTPPVGETSPQSLLKGQGERCISDGTAGTVTAPGADASPLRSLGRLGQSDSEPQVLREASVPIVEDAERVNGSSAPLASRPGRDAYKGGATTAKASPASLPQRRPLPPWSSVLLSSAYPGRNEGEADDDAALKAAGQRDAEDGGYCNTEPLLSELKQATEEERAAFESQQADMMYYWYREETSMFDHCLSRYGPGQVLFFTTSMTGERAVRDHCRLMQNLLFIKLIPHHTIDIADSEFFQRRVRRLCSDATGTHHMPGMPLLFVDTTLIGDLVTVQELEDCGELDAKMIEAGCRVLRRRVLDAYGRRRAGLVAVPLMLPVNKRPAAMSVDPGRPSSTAPVGVSRPNVTLGRCAVAGGGKL
ncbi:conserved hypothetical protein [Leishmania braziliensis MHOM/BR/75/M2904]|uniref:Uncharacterized protein n=2 Tax=Leishmania braziliensis TaxID=5660 RepID=A4H8J9_LEIBR|nr:conserved hypothetical protein [Leishmania braziliensis MHOM/BR/75/M2904]KAI5691828.1 hypothetical protein MNV84_02215 [Leishmania braziliensis]CAJ2469698.1 unnamed protein product [Leishmania braziliensis]CAM37715.1 conserved hypothetical protein [Leishmania braziliensis MHOM/BR/75/M2904]SYZ64359.1 hypothetical_protein [Leishmania braziliensis MHOM/BR/75/M2904]